MSMLVFAVSDALQQVPCILPEYSESQYIQMIMAIYY